MAKLIKILPKETGIENLLKEILCPFPLKGKGINCNLSYLLE